MKWGPLSNQWQAEVIFSITTVVKPVRRQVTVWTSASILSTGREGTHFREISMSSQQFSFNKIYSKIASQNLLCIQIPTNFCFCSRGAVCNTKARGTILPSYISWYCMMMSSNGNICRVTGLMCGEFTGERWSPLSKASDAELWCFLWSASEQNGSANNRGASDLICHLAFYDAKVMTVPINIYRQMCMSITAPLITFWIFCLLLMLNKRVIALHEEGFQILQPSPCRVMLESANTFFSFFKITQHVKIRHTLFAIRIITLTTERPIPSRCTVACKHVHQVCTIRHVLAGITLAFINLWNRNMVCDYPSWLNINLYPPFLKVLLQSGSIYVCVMFDSPKCHHTWMLGIL